MVPCEDFECVRLLVLFNLGELECGGIRFCIICLRFPMASGSWEQNNKLRKTDPSGKDAQRASETILSPVVEQLIFLSFSMHHAGDHDVDDNG